MYNLISLTSEKHSLTMNTHLKNTTLDQKNMGLCIALSFGLTEPSVEPVSFSTMNLHLAYVQTIKIRQAKWCYVLIIDIQHLP